MMKRTKFVKGAPQIPMADILPEFREVARAWNGFGTSYQIWDTVKLASDFQNAAIKELKNLNDKYGDKPKERDCSAYKDKKCHCPEGQCHNLMY